MAYTYSSHQLPLTSSFCRKWASRRIPRRSISRADVSLRASQRPMIRREAQPVEPEPEHFNGRFAGEAPTVVVGVQHEADLALLMLHAEPLQVDIPDQGAGVAPLYRQHERVSRGLERHAPRPRGERRVDLLAGPWPPIQVPRHVRPRLDGVQRVEVVQRERAEPQPRRFDGVGRSQHLFTLSTIVTIRLGSEPDAGMRGEAERAGSRVKTGCGCASARTRRGLGSTRRSTR